MILAGDVGGTKTTLGLFQAVRGRICPVRETTYPSREFESFERIVQTFLGAGRERVRRCTIGVAGPVVEGRSYVVNLSWPVDARRLERVARVDRADVLNDVVTTAWGIDRLSSRKVTSLTPGRRAKEGTAAVIAAGTGLGMALLAWDGSRYRPLPSEGGHLDFAPRNDLEIDLLRYLRGRYGRVSTERAVSGPAIFAIYRFLVESNRGRQTKKMTVRLSRADDPSAVVADAALKGEDRTARDALRLFVSLYGSAAGDLALLTRAVGGVWIGGGIAPKILSVLRDGTFIEAFCDKGRLRPLMEKIPVRVIMEPRASLLGAAAHASER